MQMHQEVTSGKVTRAMELDQLRGHIRKLITLEESHEQVVSCYVSRDPERDRFAPPPLESRLRTLRKTLRGRDLERFEERFGRIQHYLTRELQPATRGIAIFARAGRKPVFLGLQFQVPLPDRLSVDSTPDICHLVELKDTYHRYVVLISTEASARILEVNLGAVTREVWAERPELRERVGREWTHEHNRNNCRDRGKRFLKEKIEILERLMAAGGHTHLILAGSRSMTSRIRNRLPKHLQAKLIDIVPAPADARVSDVVAATLSSFVDREQQESLNTVADLVSALRRGGLGAAGTMATLEALRLRQADVLVIARAYEPGFGWSCKRCGWAEATSSPPERCPDCDLGQLQSVNLKELMIKLAERQSLEIEFVEHSDVLMDLGGVGCLLRYATPEPTR